VNQPHHKVEEPILDDKRVVRVSAHPERDTVLFSLALVAASLLLLPELFDLGAASQVSQLWVAVALGVGFAIAELSALRFMFRRESLFFSVSELPVALSLVYLAPGPAIAARLVGAMAVIYVVRRPPTYKALLNLAMFAFEMVVAYVVFRALADVDSDHDTRVIIAAIAATAACGIVSSVVVSVAISRFEGRFWHRLSSELRIAWWLVIVNAALAGMLLALVLVSPWMLLIGLVPLGLLWYIVKTYGDVDQSLRDLRAVHGFTGRVGQSLDPDEIGRAAIVEAASLLRTDGAALVLFDDGEGGTTLVHGAIEVRLPTTADDRLWAPLLVGEAAVSTGARLDAVKLPGTAPRDMMVAPISDESGLIGIVVIAGRAGGNKRFGTDDAVRLQNLTEQLAASLRRGLLHQRIEREAREDALTGLPNRVAFERSLAEATSQRQPDSVLFVVLLDLDRFKEVNDTLGHHAGDELLVEVAARLRRLLAPADVVARLASDEFAIVGHRHHREEMLELAWACVREVGRPLTIDGLEIVVTASAGLAVVEDDLEAGAPLRFADIAMFNAKTQRLGVEIYRDEIDRRTPARLSMLGDLRAAIEEEQLFLHMQPKLDLSTGTVVGAEALVRWTHPVRGVVSPAQFVRIAEDTGLIKELTDLMLERGIATLRDVRNRGHHLGLSVNLSTHDLLDSRLADRVQRHLTLNDIDPSLLTLEITESSLLIDAPRSRSTINELHEIGVHLSIDDFGTGYSSLSYLRRLPVGELKIDRSFVANVLLDEQDEVIVRSTIDLGHNLGLIVVAEGVENNEVLEHLRVLGCDIAQGYCISRPLDPEHFMMWLATTGHPSRKIDPLDFSRWIDVGSSDAVRSDVESAR